MGGKQKFNTELCRVRVVLDFLLQHQGPKMRGRIKVTDMLQEEKCRKTGCRGKCLPCTLHMVIYRQNEKKHFGSRTRTGEVTMSCYFERFSLLPGCGTSTVFASFSIGLAVAGWWSSLLLCSIRGRLLDCKPTFYLQSDGGSALQKSDLRFAAD